ncbi:hypothetical protein HDF24_19875 [Mucilaginibacter sp. X4EP1]|uniref:glycosyltransferase family protein n=1 Tax=Mucilaginibacter sp. X4EP1 TaxID=2723092 RepID=UPI0021684DEB|nr:glycosyltransferase [Mucilaginibacter sp. X4EP1]MCS3812773.1 hypothetical protein [Mucilaginibacter sp. X4EP1]
MATLNKKLVLFICPAFFGYEVSIKKALEDAGLEVDFFDERVSNNSFLKAIFRVKKELLEYVINKYYNDILKNIASKKYDYFLLIKGEVIPENFIVQFKKINPKAKLIFYTYDSFNNNNKNSIFILKHFNKCYSFDFEDVKNNPSLKLKHLFYTEEYIKQPDKLEKSYDISFVGTVHSSRYLTVNKLFNNFDRKYIFFYMPAKWFFLLQKLLEKSYRKIKWSEIRFEKISKTQVANIFKISESVFDLQRFGQTGLTMRTFEVLASGAILITTNPNIKQVEFYNPDRIIVLEDADAQDNIDEIKTKISNAKNHPTETVKGLEKYYINNWIEEFFE